MYSTLYVKPTSAVDADLIYDWLSQMNVKDTTKRIRLKYFCAFLGKCFNNGWLSNIFWRNITIRVEDPIKVGTTEDDIFKTLRQLDVTAYIELRDPAAILTMSQTGLHLAAKRFA